MTASPVIRNLARVGAGVLIGKGYFDGTETELVVTLEVVLGAVVWAVTELYYKAAKKYGWAT